MGFGQAVKHVFSNYANFQGRASRSEFWFWYLFIVLINMAIAIVYGIGFAISPKVEIAPGSYEITSLSPLVAIAGLIAVVWGLATLIPMLAVGARRFHDTDKSGWFWLFILLAPVCGIGTIILIVLWALPGTAGPNRFGAGPAQAV